MTLSEAVRRIASFGYSESEASRIVAKASAWATIPPRQPLPLILAWLLDRLGNGNRLDEFQVTLIYSVTGDLQQYRIDA